MPGGEITPARLIAIGEVAPEQRRHATEPDRAGHQQEHRRHHHHLRRAAQIEEEVLSDADARASLQDSGATVPTKTAMAPQSGAATAESMPATSRGLVVNPERTFNRPKQEAGGPLRRLP